MMEFTFQSSGSPHQGKQPKEKSSLFAVGPCEICNFAIAKRTVTHQRRQLSVCLSCASKLKKGN